MTVGVLPADDGFFSTGMIAADFMQGGIMDLERDRLKVFEKTSGSVLQHPSCLTSS